MNANDYGVVADGITDDTAALQSAITATGGNLNLGRSGTIRITGSITWLGPRVGLRNPNGVKIFADTGTYAYPWALGFSGSAISMPPINTNVSRGELILKSPVWASNQNDIWAIYNPSNGSFNASRAYYRSGEFFETKSVTNSGSWLNLTKPLYGDYTASAVSLSKISPISGFIDDLIIESNGPVQTLLSITYGRDISVNRLQAKQAQDNAVEFSRCYGLSLSDAIIYNAGHNNPGGDYGVCISNSQHGRITGGRIYGRRHPVALGGGDYVNAVPCRDIVISGATLENDFNSGAWCGDIHGNCEDIYYDANIIYNGISIGGKNCGYRGNIVRGGGQSGSVVNGSELLGGNFILKDNELEGYFDPTANNRGFIDFGGNALGVIGSFTTQDCLFSVTGNTLRSRALSSSTTLMMVANGGTSSKLSVLMRDNILDVNDYNRELMLRKDAGTAATNFIVCDNVGSKSGKTKLFPDGQYSALI